MIREKVAQRKLPMQILDAEYQFDRHKLTFYFEADRRIDFRELVSDLFSLYKTRIWMQQVDTTLLPPLDDPGHVMAIAAGSYSCFNLSVDDTLMCKILNRFSSSKPPSSYNSTS